ncbi:MAG: carbohydrate ABC transporter permease [Spirochaetales bacterium]|nr:carbohydrate ABC transporter permease [Spirochaetales bacterium]
MMKIRKIIGTVCLYILLVLLALVFFFPIYHAMVISTLESKTTYSGTPSFFFSGNLLQNLKDLGNNSHFYRSILNSLIIAVMAMVTQVFFCTMGGFAFAKYKFKGDKIIFGFVISLFMIPKLLFIIPLYKLMVWFHWIDTYLPMFVPDMANAFGILLMRQYISKLVPNSLLDAGRMDGLGGFALLMKVVFPVVIPGIAVLGTVVFIGSWNNFQLALVMISHRDMYTIPIALFDLFGQVFSTPVLMLAITISQAPLIVATILFSKQIMRNMIAGSIKG